MIPLLIGAAVSLGTAAMQANAAKKAAAGGGGGAAPTPSNMQSGSGGVFGMFDNSGWTVATSGSRATATAGDRGGMTGGTTARMPGVTAADGGVVAGSFDMSTAALLAIGLVAFGLIMKD